MPLCYAGTAMSSDPSLHLDDPLDRLTGVGPALTQRLAALGVTGIEDLLNHLPYRYEQEHEEQTIADLEALVATEGETNISARGEIAALRSIPGRTSRVEATLEDETGSLRLVWFNAGWLMRKLHPGMRLVVEGRVKPWKNYLQLANPTWHAERDDDRPRAARLRPVYPASDGLPSRRIERLVEECLDRLADPVLDVVPPSVLAARNLEDRRSAWNAVHRPRTEEDPPRGRDRLAYEELLLLQSGL